MRTEEEIRKKLDTLRRMRRYEYSRWKGALFDQEIRVLEWVLEELEDL